MLRNLTRGLVRENPVFVMMLGLCPALAVSTRVINGIGMGAGVLFVLLGSNILVSALRGYIPQQVRVPAYIVIIAAFTTVFDLALQAYAPGLSEDLGVYVPLIAVNCLILGRAQALASKAPVGAAILDALAMGLGFAGSLLLIALIREALGTGTVRLFPIPAWSFGGILEVPGLGRYPVRVAGLAAGALLVMGYLNALFGAIETRAAERKARARARSAGTGGGRSDA